MYHEHFGLERSLFSEGIAAETAVFRTAKHDRLIAQFKLALASPSSGIVLQGPAGVGKTTLTSTALRSSSTRLALAWVGGMATNSAELLELILVELGIDTLRTTRIERLQLWRQFQGEMRATGSRLFIVVERTEDLSPEVLHALDQLTAPDAAGNSGANLVLLGHAGIERHLAPSLLDSLRQRIRLHDELTPFTEAELQDYLRHQVACAGGHFDRIFAPGTVATLHRYTQGVARLVNTLCESALDVAAAERHTQLTAELITKTAVAQLKLGEPVPPTRADSVVATVAPLAPVALTVAAAPAVVPAAPVMAAPAAAAAVLAAPPAAPPAVVAPPVVASAVAAPVAPAPTAAVPPPRLAVAPPPSATPAVAAAQPFAPVAPAPRPLLATQAAAPPARPPAFETEYDGSATDVADVALADFPVLTDAVDLPVAKRAAPIPPAPRTAGTSAAPQAAAAKPVSKPVSRVETAYAAPRPAPKEVPAALATPAPAPAAKPAAPPEPEDDDVLRQTQSMRAIAVAKSIDDLSEFDAETLFGDAGLDLVSAALASAEWKDDEPEPVAAPAAPAPRSQPEAKKAPPAAETKKAPPPGDDPFDFFGLGQDAPLELIDDPEPSGRAPKAAAR